MISYIQYPAWLKPEVIPGLPIRWYGLMYLIAFIITYLLFRYQIRERKLKVEDDTILNLFFWGIIGLLIGARAFAVTIYDPTGYYLKHPLQIILPFAVENGKLRFTGIQGMSYHGGLVGAITAAIIYCRVKKIDVLDWGDMIVAAVPLGYTFGRLGNFINGELYGRVTKVPWGMVFPNAPKFPTSKEWVREFATSIGMKIEGLKYVNLPRHPSQLYEAFFEGIVLWLVMWFVLRKRRPFRGFLISAYVIGYGIVRFFIEYVREPDIGIGYPIKFVHGINPVYQFTPWNFTTGQILNFLMIVGGVIAMLVFKARAEKRNETIEGTQQKVNYRKLKKRIK